MAHLYHIYSTANTPSFAVKDAGRGAKTGAKMSVFTLVFARICTLFYNKIVQNTACFYTENTQKTVQIHPFFVSFFAQICIPFSIPTPPLKVWFCTPYNPI